MAFTAPNKVNLDKAVVIIAFDQHLNRDTENAIIADCYCVCIGDNRLISWEALLQAGLINHKADPVSYTKQIVLSQEGKERAKKVLKQIIEKLESD